MAPIAAERSIAIVGRCAHPGLTVRADRQRLSQVLVNLTSNAVKYNRHGGTITITCQEQDAGHAAVVVSDTGHGMSQDNLERIFVPFERLGAEQAAIEGTGIGLPLAKSLTEAMNGQLSAYSIPGEGSAFTVILPRAQDMIHVPLREAALASPVPAPPTTPGTAVSILYIEDHPANVEVLARFLKTRPNNTLQTAASGRAGIECALGDVPDVILLDLHLPDIPGEQVLDELRAEPATAAIPVVILSADASQHVVRRLLAKGALAYLTKPFDLAELGALLDSLAAAEPTVIG